MTGNDSTPYGRVYLITNSANGKRYIGQTIRTLEIRFKQHCALQAKCRALESAIRKYGAGCFSIKELATAADQDELNALEARYIREFSTVSPGGYNLRDGGGAKGAMHAETKEIMRNLGRRPQVIAQLATLNGSPERRRALREQGRLNWPAVEAKMLAARMDPDVQKRRIENTKATWTNPEVLQRQREFLAEMRERPEVKQKRSATMSARWAAMTPEQREAEGRKLSAALVGHKKKIDYSDEAKAHRKEIANKRWADPVFREKMLKAHADPEVVKKRGDAIRAGWARRRERLAAERAATE